MDLDFRNLNTVWSSILVETFSRLDVKTAIICPGSRSSPLAVAFAQHSLIEAIPILDERSAAFFALGMAKRLGKPVILVCTSGTAGANFYPAVIEAKESRVPLLIITADRPAELRHCHAGQTIDQVKLYGNYPNWQIELSVPELNLEILHYLRQTVIQAWEKTLFPYRGVVHLNIPFREPLAPILQTKTMAFQSEVDWKFFFEHINSFFCNYSCQFLLDKTLLKTWQSLEKGIIIAGVAHSYNPQLYCQAITNLSQFLGFPILAEALSPMRNFADINPDVITTYDFILRNKKLTEQLVPEIVIQIGELPTSKELRSWLENLDCQRYIIESNPDNFDPLHGKTIHIRTSIEEMIKAIDLVNKKTNFLPNYYFKLWHENQLNIINFLNKTFAEIEFLLEGKIAWLLSQILPEATPIFIANSMPIRDMEFFAMPNNKKIIPYFNRGANGIDGTLSTALGIAHNYQSSILLTGDLALLHDTNGFLIASKFVGHLTIILINNNGGGIFEMLPIAEFNPPFEEFFATPQSVNFSHLCQTYGIEHHLIDNWQQFQALLNPLPTKGIRVLEIPINRQSNALWLKNFLAKLKLGCSLI